MAKGAERTFVKIAVSENKQFLLELVGQKPGDLEACENCQIYVETWVTLKSERKLCYECFDESEARVYLQSHGSTAKRKVKRGDRTSKLRHAKVYCPGCGKQQPCTNIAKHIGEKHRELLQNADDTMAPSQEDTKAHSGTGPRKVGTWSQPTPEYCQYAQNVSADPSYDHEMMTDDESSDSVPPTSNEAPLDSDIGTCRHCITPLEKKEIAEHEEKCPQRCRQCPWCQEEAIKDMAHHVNNICPARKERKTVETPRTQSERDHNCRSKTRAKLIADVTDLKEKIKGLEHKMDHIEKPLKKIIERLSEGQ